MLPAPPPPASAAAPSDPEAPLPPPEPPSGWRLPGGRTTWMLAGAAAAGCAYLAVVDPNQSSWYPQCPFKAMTGYDCPGCGITRALRAFVTGHPVRALDHNALFVVALVVGVVWFALSRMRERRGQPKLELTHKSWWTAAIGVVIVAFWVGRNVPWGPLGWLGSGASGV